MHLPAPPSSFIARRTCAFQPLCFCIACGLGSPIVRMPKGACARSGTRIRPGGTSLIQFYRRSSHGCECAVFGSPKADLLPQKIPFLSRGVGLYLSALQWEDWTHVVI